MEMYDLINYLVSSFEKMDIKYFITGSIASIFYGEPRFTNDIDVVADIDKRHIKPLLKFFPPDEFYLSEDAVLDAIFHNYQFNIIHPASGLKIDIMICKKDDFDTSRFSRIKKITPVEYVSLNCASPEDIIIMKMRYYREGNSEKHIRDITSMLKISGEVIDKNYIENWAEKFEVIDIWKEIISRLKK